MAVLPTTSGSWASLQPRAIATLVMGGLGHQSKPLHGEIGSRRYGEHMTLSMINHRNYVRTELLLKWPITMSAGPNSRGVTHAATALTGTWGGLRRNTGKHYTSCNLKN